MTMPLIENVPAQEFLAGIEDNRRTLIIVGDHPEKWDDWLNAVTLWPITGAVDSMAINKAAYGWGGEATAEPFDYCATLHSYNIGLPEFPEYTIHPSTTVLGLRVGCEAKRVDHTVLAEPVGGTSELFACIVGAALGYNDIRLCGVRLEPGTIYHDEAVVKNWELWKPILAPRMMVMGNSWLATLINGGE